MELQDLKNLHEEEEPAKGINISDIIMPYIRRWRQFLSMFIVCLIAGIAYYLTTPKSYEVTSAIKLIEQSNSKGIGEIASQMSALSIFSGGGTNIDNELALFRSKSLQKEVIIALNLYVTYKGYIGLKCEDIYTKSPFLITVFDIEKADLLENPMTFEFTKEQGTYKVTFDDNNDEKAIQLDQPITEINTVDLGKIVITKRSNTTWATDFTAEVNAPRLSAIEYNEMFEIATTTKSSSIVTLSMLTQNIQKTGDFQRAMLSKYNEYTEKEKRLEASSTLSFVKERLNEITNELTSIEKDVEDYKLRNNILDLDLEAKASVEQSYETQIKLNEIETQKILLNYVDDYLSKRNNHETIIPTLGISDQGLLTMIAKHNDIVLSAQDLKTKVKSDNQSYQSIQIQITNSALAIQENIKNFQKGINLSISEFKKIEDEYLSQKKKMPIQEREFYDIKRRQKMTETLYLFLSQKCEESILNLSIGMPKATFIDLPDAGKKHSSPRGSVILMIIIIASLLLPIGFHLSKDGIKQLRQL